MLAGTSFALHSHALANVFVGLLGIAAFATVARLRMRVRCKADGASATLASNFNIAAFNLGNALGAWSGGAVTRQPPGPAGRHVGGDGAAPRRLRDRVLRDAQRRNGPRLPRPELRSELGVRS